MVAHNSPLFSLFSDPLTLLIMFQESTEFQQTWQLKFLTAGEWMSRQFSLDPGAHFLRAFISAEHSFPPGVLCLPSRNRIGWRMIVVNAPESNREAWAPVTVSTEVTGKMHSMSSSDLCRTLNCFLYQWAGKIFFFSNITLNSVRMDFHLAFNRMEHM